MPTYANWKLDVAAFANRSVTALTVGGRDMILSASNMALADAQRRHNFKAFRDIAFISTSLAGAALSGATTTIAGGTAQPIKLVEAAWLYTNVGGVGYKTQQIQFMTTGDAKMYFPPANVGSMLTPTNPPNYVPQSLACWIQGQKIYMTGTTTAQAIMLDVIKYTPDFDGSNSNFILEYGSDWLLLKTVDFLNYLLKDDPRLMISQSRIERAWDSLISFDEDYAERAFDLTADD